MRYFMLILTYDEETFEEVISGETRVVLVGTHYSPEPSEPVWNSPHGCVGTVMLIYGNENDYDVEIAWDNGRSNPYKTKDLRIRPAQNENDPNYTFRLRKGKIDG